MTQSPVNGRASGTTLLERADRPGLIFTPRVDRLTPQTFRVVGYRDDERTIPWGFWGGVFAIVVGAAVLAYEGLTGLWAIWDLVGAIAAIAAGLLLMRFGTRSSLREEPCAEIDLHQGTIRLLSSTEGLALPEIRLADVTEVVFGMTRYPVSRGKGAVKVEAFSLLVRHSSDTLIPIVEVSPDKDHLFGVAKFVGSLVGRDVTQVGLGVK